VLDKQEADSINCLIINPAWFEAVKGKIGGEWYATGESYLNGNKFNIALFDHLLPAYFTQKKQREIQPGSLSPPARPQRSSKVNAFTIDVFLI
jgi:hypothetical protein